MALDQVPVGLTSPERRVVLGLAMLLGACAPAPVTPEQLARVRAAAADCYAEHRQTIERYEIDRFGQIEAYYRTTNTQAASTQPFFDCIHAKLRGP